MVANPQPISSESQLPAKSRLNWITRRLSIRQKISCGYALALSIAAIGTAFGVVIGSHYEQQATLQQQQAQEEIRYLSQLQASSLKLEVQQQKLIFLLKKPELVQRNYSQFLEHAAEFEQLWAKFKFSTGNIKNSNIQDLEDEIDEINKYLKKYQGVPEAYLSRTKEILNQIALMNLNSEGVATAEKLLLDLNNSSDSLRFNEFLNSLNNFTNRADQEYEEARKNEDAVEVIRVSVIGGSITLSLILAVILASYTSRAIARPIQSATQVAQQVIQQKNFDLQAPVTTEDEMGALATSLNQLIQLVKQLLEEQKTANQVQLIQSEKMSSLGRMIAGVAHEINNPINFIYGNSIHASEYVEELLALLETYATEIPHPPQAVQVHAQEIDLDFLKQDLPQLLGSLKVGAERAKQIVLSLKDFSRLDQAEVQPIDLHACIDSTLIILNNLLKKDITVVRNYGNIPVIEGYTGLLYQVFMNLLSNAIDALATAKKEKLITIVTACQDDNWIVVKISDNGAGISPEHQGKMFDAFFTTKPRGVGTGLGLAISHQIIVEKHYGKITCKSEVGVGTEFAIALPIKHPPLCLDLANGNQPATTSIEKPFHPAIF